MDFHKPLRGFINSIVPEITDDVFTEFSRHTSLESYAKGSYYAKAGEIPKRAGLVLQGLFKVFYIDREGKERIRNIHDEFSPVASYGALIQDRASDVSVVAMVDAKVVSLDYQHLRDLYEKHQVWQKFGRLMAEHFMLVREKREKQFLLDDAMARYKTFQQDFVGLEERIPAYEVASYIGVTPVSLSRLKKQLIN